MTARNTGTLHAVTDEIAFSGTDQLSDQGRDSRCREDRSRKQACPTRNTNKTSRNRVTSTTRKAVSIDGPWYRHKTRPPLTNEEKIKSEMCRNLEEKGHCFYGVGCRFAHDKSELKIVLRHPKHKTQLCNDYHGQPALCLFGSRCSYIHESGPRLREFTSVETGNSSTELRDSPLFCSRLRLLEDTIHEYSLETVRTILKRKGVSQDDICDIEKLPSVVLRLLRRALTSPHADQTPAPAVQVPAYQQFVAFEERVTVKGEWSTPIQVPRTLYKIPESLTPPEDYLSSFSQAGRGA